MTLVEMCSHLATERAGIGTLHLTVGASELYPNPRGNGELTDRLDLRSTAPVLDPTVSHSDHGKSMDLSPILRQVVKTHFSLNGELSHGIVT